MRHGFYHPVLSLCGLLHQTYALRHPREEKQERAKRKEGQCLETDLWADAVDAIGDAPCDDGVQWVYVADRGADILDHIVTLNKHGAGFVIRAKHDRRIHVNEGEARPTGKLFEELRQEPSQGTIDLELRARPGKSARNVTLHLSAICGVAAQSPQAPPGRGKNSGDRILFNAVRVWEETPAEKDPVEWLLLTQLPVDTLEQNREISLIYSCRWLVEEFHKALNSGMAAEKLQLEEGKRLMSAVSVMSIVALRLLDLRDSARLRPDAPASEGGFDEVDVQILSCTKGKAIVTIKDAVWAIARLGGFPGRKGDGSPGMMVLWRGMNELLAMKSGWLLAIKMNRLSKGGS